MYIRISYLVLFCCLVNKSYPTLLWSPWTVAYQAPLSMGFPRPEYWNGLPFPPPGDLPDPKMELTSPVTPELAGGFFTTEPTGKPSLCFSQSVSSVTQSCPTLCDPTDCSLPTSSVHGISQARTLEWVVISVSRGSSQPRDQTQVSCLGRQILYHWASRETHIYIYVYEAKW